MIGPLSYVFTECAEKVAAITGDGGKWTCGESLADERTTEKLAAKGKGLGESGNGAGRLRIDLVEAGMIMAREGDWRVLKIDWDAMRSRKRS